jgi:hypothetical protein
MKKLLLFFIYFAPMIIFGQCYLEPNGVTTDPRNNFNNAENPLHPQYKNRFFDWTQSYFTNLHWAPHATGATTVIHPHSLPNDAVISLYNNNDFFPEDGWELLCFNMGYLNFWDDPNGVGDPNNLNEIVYYVLYNKNRSLIRVYFRLANLLTDYKVFLVSLGFSGISEHKTAVFSSVEKVVSPLLDFDPLLEMQATNAFFGNHKWHYADFTVMYDPCTCDNTAEIEINFQTTNRASILLTGTSTGNDTLVSTLEGWNRLNAFSFAMEKSKNQLLGGQKYFRDMQVALAHSDKNTADANSTTKVYLGLNYLSQALTFGGVNTLSSNPYIGEALSIFNTFVGASSTATVKVPPMAIELNHNFTSVFGQRSNSSNQIVQVPGSKNISLNDKYPLYNETIGVLNLLDKPRIYTTIGLKKARTWTFSAPAIGEDKSYIDKVRATYTVGAALSKDMVDLVINPASNLEVAEVFGQIHIQFDDNPVIDFNGYGNFINPSGIIRIDDKNFVSPIVPLSCLNDYAFFMDFETEFNLFDLGITLDQPGAFAIAAMNHYASLQFKSHANLILTVHLKDSQGKSYIHRYTFKSENASKEIMLDVSQNGNSDNFHPIITHSRNIMNDLFWGSSNYNWSFIDLEDSHAYENKIIQESKTAFNNIVVNGESTIMEQNNGGATELIAGMFIEINDGVSIEPDVELRIENYLTGCSSMSYPIADFSKVANACTDQRYINRARPHGKNKIHLDSNLLEHSDYYFDFYPNPASDHLSIRCNSLKGQVGSNVRILDLQGRVVFQNQLYFEANGFIHSIPLANLPNGLYLIEVVSFDGQVWREKVIIQK